MDYAMIAVLLTMLAYGAVHSLLAWRRVKSALKDRTGERAYHGLYRITYNIIATLTLAPIFALIIFRPGEIVWRIPQGWLPLLLIIQAVGLIGLFVSLLQIDLGQFSGLSQLLAYLNGDPLPLPREPLQTDGVYRLVRHPLYLFSLMVIWPIPTMTEAYLGFCIGSTIYFVAGSYMEERRLLKAFGARYIDYQKRVPWLFPPTRS